MGPRDMEPGEKVTYVLVVIVALSLPAWGMIGGLIGALLSR